MDIFLGLYREGSTLRKTQRGSNIGCGRQIPLAVSIELGSPKGGTATLSRRPGWRGDVHGLALYLCGYEVRLPGHCHPLVVHIIVQRPADVLYHSCTGRLVQRSYGTGHRGSGQISDDILSERRISGEPAPDPNLHIAKPRIDNQSTKLVSARESECRSETSGRLGAYVPLEGLGQRGVERLMLEASPYPQRQAPHRSEHTKHLLESGGAIRRKLQSLLTVRDVEAGIRERQRGCVSFAPRDRSPIRRRRRTGDSEHPGIEIESGYLTRRADK